MAQIKEQRTIRSVAGVLLLLFLSYFANISLFQHTHIVNGVTIVHSHLHSSHHSSTPMGGHSISDLTLIAALSDCRMEPSVSFELREVFCSVVWIKLESVHILCHSASILEHAPLRGPPAV